MRNFPRAFLAAALLALAVLTVGSVSAQTVPTPTPSPVTPTPAPLGAPDVQPDPYHVDKAAVSLPVYPSQFGILVTNIVSPTTSVDLVVKVSDGQALVTQNNTLHLIKAGTTYTYTWDIQNIGKKPADVLSIDPNGAVFSLTLINKGGGSLDMLIQRTADKLAAAPSSSALPAAEVSLPSTAGKPSGDPLAAVKVTQNQANNLDPNSPWNDYAPYGLLALLLVVLGVPLLLSTRAA